MNWQHWQTEISKTIEEVLKRIEESGGEAPSALWLVEEKRSRTLIDEICNSYATTKSWPINMTPTQSALVLFRLREAEFRAQELAQVQNIPNQSPVELDLEMAKALKYLLVDYWHSGGRTKWLTR